MQITVSFTSLNTLIFPLTSHSVDKERREKSLPPLHRFVIDVISHSETNLDAEDADALKRTKMSSTFIREWIVQQRASDKSS